MIQKKHVIPSRYTHGCGNSPVCEEMYRNAPQSTTELSHQPAGWFTKTALVALLLTLSLLLSGCGEAPALPSDWEADWTVVCPALAVEPLEGFALHESNDALYLSGIYYATWVTGESRPHTNESGEAAEVFDGQIYVLVQEFRDGDTAAANVSKWITREKQNFATGEDFTLTCGGQEFSVLSLLDSTGTNPYTTGLAAFAVRGEWAICVELLSADGQGDDAHNTLEAFLNGFHYSE